MNQFAALPDFEAATPARFSADQFLRMYELGVFEDRRLELVHGEIIELSPPHVPHSRMHAKVIARLVRLYPEDRLLVDVFIRLDNQSVRAFDVTVLRDGVQPEKIVKPEEVLLGIEVAQSSIRRDLGEKKRHYAAAGITSYLVVDLNADRMLLMQRNEAGALIEVADASFGEGVSLPGGAGRLRLS